MKLNAVDLFAGPGGWDLACRVLGFDPLGVELDDAACATRAAQGLRTLQGDVAQHDPRGVAIVEFGHADVDLLLASPPCPTFSSAGKGDGIADMALVYEAAECAARGKPVPPLPWRDERSALVVEPLRWAIALQPRFLCWEQVPPVLPFWEHCAEILRQKGWNVWTGKVEAERYGVPQTRERAILMADREGPVHPPRPTHQRYVKGEPQRHEVTLEGEVLPWVSMAEALGWSGISEVLNYHADPDAPREDSGGGKVSPAFDPNERPSRTLTHRVGGWRLDGEKWHPDDMVGFPRADDTGAGGERERDRRPASEPAFTVGEKARSTTRVLRANAQKNATERGEDESAPTITGGHDMGDRVWVTAGQTNSNGPKFDAVNRPARTIASDVEKWTAERPAPIIVTTRRSKDGILVGRQLPPGEGENVGGHNWKPPELAACGCDIGVVDADGFCACCHAHLDDPDGLYAIQGDGTHSNRDCPANWPAGRPATTVAGDPRISQPGRHDPEESGSQQKDAIRVSLEEAAILQSFPPDYPFQGTKSQRFLQVGNAVPVAMAIPILGELLGIDWHPIHSDYLATYPLVEQPEREAA